MSSPPDTHTVTDGDSENAGRVTAIHGNFHKPETVDESEWLPFGNLTEKAADTLDCAVSSFYRVNRRRQHPCFDIATQVTKPVNVYYLTLYARVSLSGFRYGEGHGIVHDRADLGKTPAGREMGGDRGKHVSAVKGGMRVWADEFRVLYFPYFPRVFLIREPRKKAIVRSHVKLFARA